MDIVRHTVPDNVHQLHVQTTFHIWKTRGCQCSFRLLMMGGVSSETCWASYKYGIITFWYIVASWWIFLYEFYYDARIHERHVKPHFNQYGHIIGDCNRHYAPIVLIFNGAVLCPRILLTCLASQNKRRLFFLYISQWFLKHRSRVFAVRYVLNMYVWFRLI